LHKTTFVKEVCLTLDLLCLIHGPCMMSLT